MVDQARTARTRPRRRKRAQCGDPGPPHLLKSPTPAPQVPAIKLVCIVYTFFLVFPLFLFFVFGLVLSRRGRWGRRAPSGRTAALARVATCCHARPAGRAALRARVTTIVQQSWRAGSATGLGDGNKGVPAQAPPHGYAHVVRQPGPAGHGDLARTPDRGATLSFRGDIYINVKQRPGTGRWAARQHARATRAYLAVIAIQIRLCCADKSSGTCVGSTARARRPVSLSARAYLQGGGVILQPSVRPVDASSAGQTVGAGTTLAPDATPLESTPVSQPSAAPSPLI